MHLPNDCPKENDDAFVNIAEKMSSSNSVPITPAAAEGFSAAASNTRPASTTPNEKQAATEELLRLKLELAQAQTKITRLDQELAQSRHSQLGSGRPTPTLSPDQEGLPVPHDDSATSRIPVGPVFNGPATNQFPPHNAWQGPIPIPDDCRSEISDAMSASGFNRSRTIWGNSKPGFQSSFVPSPVPLPDAPQSIPWGGARNQSYLENPPFGSPIMDAFRGDRLTAEQDFMARPLNNRRGNRYDNRFGQQQSFNGGYGSYSNQFDPPPAFAGAGPGVLSGDSGLGMGIYSAYPQQGTGSSLSPHAREFTSTAGSSWKNDVSSEYCLALQRCRRKLTKTTKAIATEGQTYLPTTEPLNYRRLLDRNVNCNWKYIVDKIVCNNDQQASIFLQQKLKVGTPEQKYEIVEAIVAQAYPLMVNRFGNFLVQRCFEHGTPEQVIKIAEAIRGNTLNLSMDPFGCHVVQKAFDSVPEDYKAIMVHELLRRIPETVIHRYACHVWQKLFELRWTESPPQIMKFVNEALRGMWHEVALGETGSLVVQNIFENCLEEDKVRAPQTIR